MFVAVVVLVGYLWCVDGCAVIVVCLLGFVICSLLFVGCCLLLFIVYWLQCVVFLRACCCALLLVVVARRVPFVAVDVVMCIGMRAVWCVGY